MTDTPPANPAPPLPALQTSATFAIGFLSVVQDDSGVYGGYLVTNAWGRPVEFRLTTAVQPNRVQQILYGPTLTEYLHADVIGKTLVEKTSTPPSLIVTDSPPALALRARLGVPVIAVRPPGAKAEPPADAVPFTHARSSVPLFLWAKCPEDRAEIEARLERVDPAVDLAEPFARIREAVTEARKTGVTSRAA